MVLQAIKYKRGSLQILDQLKLPHAEVYDEIRSSEDAWHAIKEMRTRGAPAIAIVAALSLAVELQENSTKGRLSTTAEEVVAFIIEKLDYLVTSRPTAVNLADAARKLRIVVEDFANSESADGKVVKNVYVKAAEQMLIDDVLDNEAIGKHGAEWIKENTEEGKRGSIPATLVTDSMAAALLKLKRSSDRIAAIVTGADRVAANGDTANKIGTYSLAILARYHGVKFLVAAPRTTIDLETKSGEDIVIEERPGKEVTMVKGPRFDGVSLDLQSVETVSIAADGIGVWNPAFDVTPAELIDGIVTEVGVAEKDGDGKFDLARLFVANRSGIKPSTIGGL
ncbi:S-methyl-5-thioribose-1-phosphate isomerase [Elasticomyces elasticus]|nr:S-methyl-5-thioribose-1-phosphate isomerase [Elasticomyces elasticus]